MFLDCSTFIPAFVMKISGLTFLGTYSLTKLLPWAWSHCLPFVMRLVWITGFLGGDELFQGEVVDSGTRNKCVSWTET